jgi:large subunit ribosomal protein L9
MKVILNADLENLGLKGEVVEVKSGFARNYLLPKNLALPATKGSVRQAEQMRRARDERDRKERAGAEELATKISSTPLNISARAGEEGQLFGSITTSEIADRLSELLGLSIDRRKVQLDEPIRSLGVHGFSVQLHPEVKARGSLEVAPHEPAS